MKTRKFCPKCGRPIVKSDLTKGYNRYAFRCFGCDEDFFHFEVLNTNDLELVRSLQQATIRRETENGGHVYSAYKPYPRYKNL